MKSLGADKIVDYTKEDFTKNGEACDLFIDILGKSSFSRCKNSLTQNGRLLFISFKTKQLLQMLWTLMVGSKKVMCAIAAVRLKDLIFLKELVEAGELKPVIDRRYPLEQIVEAHRYVDTGRKKGNVVITVAHDSKT